ncbi:MULTISPECIES: ABC transporter permease [unclassified Saccharopolyspora]|uniref:ABC transporter permease n=1 Tax=Saccharopolyspora TaxID=1835 RepID=UPI0025DD429D|nr:MULTISPECIES: ABC transporter permease subunit [unclassified Saccharopolyspora]
MIDELAHYFSSPSNREVLLSSLGQHAYLALIPLVIGALIALPLGRFAQRNPRVRGVLLGSANVLYTVPSLALFVILPAVLGTGATASINVVVALTIYNAALLVRPVMDGLGSVPGHVVTAATALGYRPRRRFFAVELPLAVPVLATSLRVASVSNVSLVSVGALIGIGGLGRLFTDGFQRDYLTPILLGVVLTLLLAMVGDLLIVALRRALTPWQRAGGRAA